MLVFVAGGEEEPERDDHHPGGDELHPQDRLAEKGPGEDPAEEGGGREEDLRPGGAQVLRAPDVEHDGRAVAERPDARARSPIGRDWHRTPSMRNARIEVRSPRDDPLREGGLGRGEAVHERGQVVVEPPAEAGEGHEDRAPARNRSRRAPARITPAATTRTGRGPGLPVEVLPEERPGEDRGGHGLEVQPEGDGGGRGEREAEKQEDRPEPAPEDHRSEEHEEVPRLPA